MKITNDIAIEDLIDQVPESVDYMIEKGIRCIVCGEPVWGSLEEAAGEKGFTDVDIQSFVDDLQKIADHQQS